MLRRFAQHPGRKRFGTDGDVGVQQELELGAKSRMCLLTFWFVTLVEFARRFLSPTRRKEQLA
jgi:hypothetical protein